VEHPLLERREIRNTGVLVITSDRGLAGSYNAQVMRRSVEFFREFDPTRLKLYVIGKKGNLFFRRRGLNIVESLSINTNAVAFGDAADVTRVVRTAFEKGDIDELYLVYTKFISAMTQRPQTLKLLPIETPEAAETGPSSDYIFEPAPDRLLAELLP